MPGTVFDKGNQVLVGGGIPWMVLVHQFTDQGDDVDIGPLIVATNIVGVVSPAIADDKVNASVMVIYIKPVADLFTIPINRKFFSIKAVSNNKWDQFFWKLVRAIVVRAVTDGGIKTIGMVIAANDMIRACLASRIRGVGQILMYSVNAGTSGSSVPYTSSVETW